MNSRNSTCLIAACLLVMSCSGSDAGDTYIRFSFDDQSYQTTHATFTIANLNRGDWKYIGIGKDVTQHDAFEPPSASLQWRMELKDSMTLEGKTIAIRDLNESDMADPLVNLVISEDISVANFSKTDVSVTITSISDGIIEGSFRGNELTHSSGAVEKTVDVTGTFRARLPD